MQDLQKIFIKLTSLCNHDCVYCFYYRNFSQDYEQMSKEQLEITIDKIKNYNKKVNVALTGGEPFINKELLHHALYLLSKCDNVSNIFINTNATLIDENDIKIMKKYNVKLFISAPTMDKQSYKEITRRDNYQKFIDNLKSLVQNNIQFRTNVVVSSFNIDKIKEIYYSYYLLGVKSITFTPVFFNQSSLSNENYSNDYILTKEQYYKIFEVLRDIRKLDLINDFGMTNVFEPCTFNLRQDETVFNCACGNKIAIVNCNGDLKLCGNDPFGKKDFGNINNIDFETYFNTAESYKCATTAKVPMECSKCVLNSYCNGDCRPYDQDKTEKIIRDNLNIYDYESFSNFCALLKNGGKLTKNCQYIIDNLVPPWDNYK